MAVFLNLLASKTHWNAIYVIAHSFQCMYLTFNSNPIQIQVRSKPHPYPIQTTCKLNPNGLDCNYPVPITQKLKRNHHKLLSTKSVVIPIRHQQSTARSSRSAFDKQDCGHPDPLSTTNNTVIPIRYNYIWHGHPKPLSIYKSILMCFQLTL